MTVLASLSDTALGGVFAIAGALIALYGVHLTTKIPAEVAEFATQLAGALDGVRQAIAAHGQQQPAEEVAKRAQNVTVYLSETERLLGGARLHLNRIAERRANEVILELRGAEQALRQAAAPSAPTQSIQSAAAAHRRGLEAQRRFARAVRSPLLSRLLG
jgi:hypothetical protein